MAGKLFGCTCFHQKTIELRHLDYRHRGLSEVPAEVFAQVYSLEELHLDNNNIGSLHKELFCCHELKRFTISDNDLKDIPAAIGNFVNLVELDIGRNNIESIPEAIKQCKCLQMFEASVNPLGKLPDSFTQLLNLTTLLLNDCYLNFLPGNIGRLANLKILEVRENHLSAIPNSIGRLTKLERLDIGNNELTDLPDGIGNMGFLLELWCDQNKLVQVPNTIGHLKQLMSLDLSNNCLTWLPSEIEGCMSLSDLHLSSNQLSSLPESLGRLTSMTTLKLDKNQLSHLPFSIGGLVSLSELNLSGNVLETLPPSVGLLRHLRVLYVNDNRLAELPPEIGSCSGITVLHLRGNQLRSLPEELGRIPRLHVVNVSDNRLRSLPFSFTKLRQLHALWLSDNQTQPLVQLQSDRDPDTGDRCLTCYLLPQMSPGDGSSLTLGDASNNNTVNRSRNRTIQFDTGGESDHEGRSRMLPKDAILDPRRSRHAAQWQQAYRTPPEEKAGNQMNHRLTSSQTTPVGKRSDSHYLYHQDKAKLMRDKVRLQQQQQQQQQQEQAKQQQQMALPPHSLYHYSGPEAIPYAASTPYQTVMEPGTRTPMVQGRRNLDQSDYSSGSSSRPRPMSGHYQAIGRMGGRVEPQSSRPRLREASGYESDTAALRAQRSAGMTAASRRPIVAPGTGQQPIYPSAVRPNTLGTSHRQPIYSSGYSTDGEVRYRSSGRRNDGYVSDGAFRPVPVVPPPPPPPATSHGPSVQSAPRRATGRESGYASDTVASGTWHRQRPVIGGERPSAFYRPSSMHTLSGQNLPLTGAFPRGPAPVPSRPLPPAPATSGHGPVPVQVPVEQRNSTSSDSGYAAAASAFPRREPVQARPGATDRDDVSDTFVGPPPPPPLRSPPPPPLPIAPAPGPHASPLPAGLLSISPTLTNDSAAIPGVPAILNGDHTPGGRSSDSGYRGVAPSGDERRMVRVSVTIKKSPGLGFSIAGGVGSPGNPFRSSDPGIFVTKVTCPGPAEHCLRPGDKILSVNGIDFSVIDHNQAVGVLKTSDVNVEMVIERMVEPCQTDI